jgi:NAD(P)-dependent dehydrogenase (short-subunit alcohol dehydrogenase family)
MNERAVAIITGGSGGYGAGIAEVFRDDGIEVFITGRNRQKLDETASRLGVSAIQADATRADDWDRVFEQVLTRHGRVDYLVNNAGGAIKVAQLTELSDEEILATVTTNLTSVILGSKRAARVMKEQSTGTIVNIGSVVSLEAWPGWTVYSAAKGGLHQFTKCLYAELRESGARATLIVPSWGQTDFSTHAGLPGNSGEVRGLSTKPTELGELVLYCCRLPQHLWLQEAILWPRVQEVEPL